MKIYNMKCVLSLSVCMCACTNAQIWNNNEEILVKSKVSNNKTKLFLFSKTK